MMPAECICHECGAPVPADSPSGFCGQCLLGLALDQAPNPVDPAAPTGSASASGQPPQSAEVGRDLPGQNFSEDDIPGYRLQQQLGQGGCGVVYLAEQERPVRRKVAIKVIKSGMDTRQVVARFDAERQVLARLDHPNIAKVLDAGATTRGRPYFAMELVGGLKITEFCDQNGLSAVERLRLFVQVCRAIQHAHQKGIIHRDIKPSNVLVAEHDGVAIPKVIDFGIAKATQGKLTDETLFTAFEQFLGTPVYMSPEQAQWGGLDVDTRSDIYSLGVLLYELLTGKPPFDFDSSSASGFDAVRRTVLEKDALKPSTRLQSMSPEQLARIARARQTDAPRLLKLLRGDLDWIVMKCLEKDRARRYETANGLALDVERYLASEPVTARPPSPAYRLRKFVERNRLVTISAAAVSVSLIAGTALSSWLAIRATRAEREQRALRLEAQSAKQRANEQLWASCLAEARARRITQEAGARFESLAAITKAAAIRPSLELRNEAIATLAQADIRWIKGKKFGPGTRAIVNRAATDYATCDPEGTVGLFAISNDVKLATLPEVNAPAKALWLFSPDGNELAVGYADNRVRVWDCRRLTCLLTVPSPEGMDFSPDGERLALSIPGQVQVFELAKQNDRTADHAKIVDLQGGPWALSFHPNGKLMAAFSELQTNVLVLDLETGQQIASFSHEDGLRRIAWSPDGRYLASSCQDNFLHLWETSSGNEVWRVPGNHAIGVAFNHQGTLLASAGWDGRTRLWDFQRRRQLVSIYKSGEIAGFTADGRTLVEIPWNGHGVDVFEVANAEGMRTLYTHASDRRGPAGVPAFSQDGTLLAFPSSEGVRLWDNLAQKQIWMTGDAQTSVIGFDAGDRHLLLGDAQGLLPCRLTTPRTAHPSLAESRISVEPQTHVTARNLGRGGGLSANGESCFVVGNNRCEIFNTSNFADPVLTGIHPGMRFVAENHDGSLLASGAWLSPGVVVWDGRTGEAIKSFPNPDTTSVSFSPNGHYLVAATEQRYIFWQVGSWTQVLSIPQPAENDFVPMMAFSRDGRLFAGTHSRTIVRLHDAATGEVLADLEPPDPHTVTGLAFNQDGSCLAVCEGVEATRVWDLHVIRARLAPLGLDWKVAPGPDQ